MILPAAGDCLLRNSWVCGKYLTTRRSTILADLRQHVILTVIAVAIGFALSIPLSLLVRRFRRTEGVVIGVTSVLYGIPSVALFAALVPITGLTATTVEIGLVTYTLVIFVRNTLAGLDSVPEDVRGTVLGLNGATASVGWVGAAALGALMISTVGFEGFGPLAMLLALLGAAGAMINRRPKNSI